MTLPDIGNDTDIGTHHLAETMHLPEIADPHLHHSHLMLSAYAQQGQRNADFIVEISLRL